MRAEPVNWQEMSQEEILATIRYLPREIIARHISALAKNCTEQQKLAEIANEKLTAVNLKLKTLSGKLDISKNAAGKNAFDALTGRVEQRNDETSIMQTLKICIDQFRLQRLHDTPLIGINELPDADDANAVCTWLEKSA